MRFSANLGFLFTDLPLPDAIRAAKRQGFDAVEMHFPYATNVSDVVAALNETGMRLESINTVRGNVEAGDSGLCAMPGREVEARAAIDQAVSYAAAAGAKNIHVMAGKSSGQAAFDVFAGNLRYAAAAASAHGVGIMIEPINPRDVPGYFLSDLPTALRLVDACDGKIGVMFDCYHMQIIHGDLLRTAHKHMDIIRHIQFASVPDRADPDQGEINYGWLLPALMDAGYAGTFGAEYRTSGRFDWIETFRKARG